MLNIKGIDHLVLRTGQVEQMCLFYCGVLGCTIERETPPDIGLVQLRAGNALIDLVSVGSKLGAMDGGPPEKSENNLDHFCLQLRQTSEKEIRSHLASHSVKVGEFAERYGAQGFGLSVYIQDPDGNTVELRSEIISGSS